MSSPLEAELTEGIEDKQGNLCRTDSKGKLLFYDRIVSLFHGLFFSIFNECQQCYISI